MANSAGAAQDQVRIKRINLIRYEGRSTRTRVLYRPQGFILRMWVEYDGQEHEIWGEAVAPGRLSNDTWRALKQTMNAFANETLSLREWAESPKRHSHFSPWWSRYIRGNRNIQRFANLAIEAALLDLLRQTESLPAFGWSDTSTDLEPTFRNGARLPADMTDFHIDKVRGAVAHCEEPVLLVHGQGDVDTDITLLQEIVRTEHLPEPRPVLWFIPKKPWSQSDATRFISRVAALVRDGELSDRVVAEDITDARQPRNLVKLQKLADSINPSKADDDVPVRVVSRRRLNSLHSVRKVVKAGNVGGIVLDPNELGSYFTVKLAAEACQELNPALRLYFKGANQGSLLTRDVEQCLLASTSFDEYALDLGIANWPVFRDNEDIPVLPRSGPASRVDLLEVASKIDRLEEIPAPKVSDKLRGNDFSDHIFPGAPLGLPRQSQIEVAALAAGLSTRKISPQFVLVEQDGTEDTVGFYRSQSTDTSEASSILALDKGATRALLSSHDLPITPGVAIPNGEEDSAEEKALELGFPLVVKPAEGSHGEGISTNIRSVDELRHALRTALESRYGDTGLVIERHVEGEDYRLITTQDRVLAVIRRDPAAVWGDGVHTVEELIALANVARRRNPNLARSPIRVDDTTARLLEEQGHTIDSVPEPDEYVKLMSVANISQGGTSSEVRDETHQSIKDLAVRATKVAGLPHAGVDILMPDHRKHVDDQDLTITEINNNPALLLRYPMYGPSRNVCDTLTRELADRAGMSVSEANDPITAHVTITGHVRGVGYRRWIRNTAQTLELDGWVQFVPDSENQVEAVLHGPALKIGVFNRLAMRGSKRSHPTDLYSVPITTKPKPGFVINKLSTRLRRTDMLPRCRSTSL